MKTNQLLAATLAAFISVSAFGQTVDEIVDKHVAALGGIRLFAHQIVTAAHEGATAAQTLNYDLFAADELGSTDPASAS